MSMLTSPSISFQDILQDVTRRIVETAHPKRIVLFGSAARGAMTRDSDLDMLVIMPGPVHRRQTAQKILRQLHGVALPVDIVVVTEEDVKNSEQSGYSIIRPAMKDGRIVYDAE